MAPFQFLVTTATLSLAALSLSGLAQGRPLTTTAPADDDDDAPIAACDCYKAMAFSSALFTHRKFFDFRNIPFPLTPAPIGRAADDAAAGPTHPYFLTPAWSDTWGIRNWASPGRGVIRVNSPNNVFIAAADDDDHDHGHSSLSSSSTPVTTHLTLRTLRHPAYQSTAEVESHSMDYQFLTMRMRARTRGSSGAVTALFTYNGRTKPVQEADYEIRTVTDPRVMQFTNQPGWDGQDKPDATRIVTLPSPWTEWQEYRYDWTPGSSDWFFNGKRIASIQYQTPTEPLSVLMNVWSNGGGWSGVMKPGAEAEMQVQWFDLTYNSTSEPAVGACSKVCVIDDLI
ncbi:concanavalin A-like lectin/glucanase domain-containing protein [Xylariaceae sp. FL1651]|nr:concanavalin A-like lectin/glucanase domain-containing protein [Xylariaceae sp. FL1651]